ncbi:MAG: N-acetylmuramoyl-L-alanine amidase [Spirochaetales bacterium]
MRLKKISGFVFVLIMSIHLFADIPSGYMTFQDVAKETQSTLYWDSMSGNGMLEKNGHYLAFSTYSPLILFDRTHTETVSLPVNYNGTFYASQDFFNSAKNLFNTLPPEVNFRIGSIIIDAGHGGKDPGAIATHNVDGKDLYIEEKNVALFVAQDLHKKLSLAYPDKKILLTRDDDTFLTLEERTDIANTVYLGEHEAILYISIHVNSALNKSANGFEVWYLSPGYRRVLINEDDAKNIADDHVATIVNSILEEEFTTESILIAKYILDGMDAQIGDVSPSRGLKEEEWFVVKNAKMPSVLIELGFLSNKEEAILLADENHLHKLSLGIYNGLTAFVTHFEQSRGFTGGH